jgi:hypothetical protein
VSGPTRDTPAGRAYRDLQNKARRERRPTDELLALYALEGFLPPVGHLRAGRRARPLGEVLDGYPALARARWAAWVRKQRLADRLPLELDHLLSAVTSSWHPASGTWQHRS